MSYAKVAMRIFAPLADTISPYFSDLLLDLKKARIKFSVQEYLSMGFFLCMIIFAFELPIFSIIFGILLKNFLFGFITSFTVSSFLTVFFFLFYISYPKFINRDKSKQIDNFLPFASLHLSTIASAKLPLHKILEIFSKFTAYGELTDEIKRIESDVSLFGVDINTALERGIERTPSKNLKELIWGILSINRSGGDLSAYLKEKSKTFISEYRRKLYEFSHQLTIFIEIYLTAIILGAVFFIILTSIMSVIGGVASNILFLQFFLIFVFLPLISVIFIILIRSSTPGGE
ncbi:MAG: type II secretion system F family protein [Candidatus Aenigmatarchaeota archaeon]